MTKIDLYQRIALTRDVPEENLKRGDLAWLVDYMKHPEGGEDGAVLEIFNIFGESIEVVVIPVSAIEPLSANHVPTVRTLERK